MTTFQVFGGVDLIAHFGLKPGQLFAGNRAASVQPEGGKDRMGGGLNQTPLRMFPDI
jgi:hypothetical protein